MPGPDEAAPEKNKGNRPLGAADCYEWMEAFLASLIIVTVLFTFFFRIVSVSGSSMLPALHSGDRVVLSGGFYRPRRGDVVVISHTDGLAKPIIKRIVALENQTVDIDFDAGVVSVDGKALDESAYMRNGITKQPSDFRYPLVVPKGHAFVLGDNRAVSNDSRSSDVGMVDVRNICGKAEMILFPPRDFGKIKG